eukprot:5519809-Amphidinium_carterae.4
MSHRHGLLDHDQKVNLDEIYGATPTLAQLRHHSVYMTDIQSAFLNTLVQPGTTILAKPPPECETNDDILWKLKKQLYGLRDSPLIFNSIYRLYSYSWDYDKLSSTTEIRSMCLLQQ